MSAGPLLLGLDCATPHLALAVVDPTTGTLAAASDDVGRAHAALVLEALDELLAACGARPGDFAALGVGVGPGSYTGVRVGVATALGIARAWGVPCVGASSLTALPGTLAPPATRVVALSDARRGNVYAQSLERLVAPPWAVSYAESEPPRRLARADLDAEYPGMVRVEYGTTHQTGDTATLVVPDASALAWAADRHAGAQAQPPKPHYL